MFTLKYEPWVRKRSREEKKERSILGDKTESTNSRAAETMQKPVFKLQASWAYNLYLSSIDKEYIQEQLLLEVLNLDERHMRTYSPGTRRTAAVFTCLMLQPPSVCAELEWKRLGFEPEGAMWTIIPNDTPVWITWKEKVLGVMRNGKVRSRDSCYDLLQTVSDEKITFEPNDQNLLENLLEDARTAYDLAMINSLA